MQGSCTCTYIVCTHTHKYRHTEINVYTDTLLSSQSSEGRVVFILTLCFFSNPRGWRGPLIMEGSCLIIGSSSPKAHVTVAYRIISTHYSHCLNYSFYLFILFIFSPVQLLRPVHFPWKLKREMGLCYVFSSPINPQEDGVINFMS